MILKPLSTSLFIKVSILSLNKYKVLIDAYMQRERDKKKRERMRFREIEREKAIHTEG